MGKHLNFLEYLKRILLREFKKLSTKKAVQSTGIPLKIIRENADIFGSYLYELVNDCISKGIFPDILKHANIALVSKENYRPVSLPPAPSKIF